MHRRWGRIKVRYMKVEKRITALLLSAVIILGLTACSGGTKLKIEQPKSVSAVDNDAEEPVTVAIESSENVNGKRFAFTLTEFTEHYNSIKKMIGDNDLIIMNKWSKMGVPETDNHGVEIQYYYYDDENVNITATVETESGKLMNIGVGTTMSNFMAQESGENNSDDIIRKAAVVTAAAGSFGTDKIDTLQDVFYQLATGSEDSLWYEGFVFTLSTKDDKQDSKNGVMLFRVFPISAELKKEWKLTEYKK